jgi:hypothetical protein
MTRDNAKTIGMTVAALGVLVALVGAAIRLIGWALPGSIDGAISAATDEVVRYVRSTAPCWRSSWAPPWRSSGASCGPLVG